MSTPTHDDTRPLPVLRAMIDSLDREVLQLLARRASLVREVAQCKREHRVPIRDLSRERFILTDRRGNAAALGLSPAVIESIFRLILWDSRDRQAALRAELPTDLPARTVAIIGGSGRMGSCLARLFADLGHHVLIADLDTPTTPAEAAELADVVVVSVPIESTVAVIRELGPRVRPDALLMDVTSVKREPVQAMLESSAAGVVGTHPMFDPSVHSLQGQRVVLCPARGQEWAGWVRLMFKARGLNIKETTPEDHDRVMAVVQVLTHFSTEVMGRALCAAGVNLAETLSYTSPVYQLEMLMTARHFAQSADLYASIEMGNPEAARVTSCFAQAAEELRQIVQRQDRSAFGRMFAEVRSFFGAFTETAMEQSSFLIDRLVERS